MINPLPCPPNENTDSAFDGRRSFFCEEKIVRGSSYDDMWKIRQSLREKTIVPICLVPKIPFRMPHFSPA